MEYSPIKFKENMEKHSFNLKKMYGQNFIIDENIINNIIDKSEIDKDTLVIEVGPGAGSLTYKLGKYAGYVIAYEIDTSLRDLLSENISDLNNVKVIYQDFLKSNIKIDIEKYNYKKIYLVANLPYYITTPIILKVIEDDLPIDKMVVMVQKEVGDRFKAVPGTKDYSSLSVYLNYYYEVKKVLDVSKNVFIPKPNVDSIVIEFKKKDNLQYLKNKELFFKLVRDSFKQKRKTIKNNLKEYDLNRIQEILEKYNMDLSIRAEQIPIDVFIDISNKL